MIAIRQVLNGANPRSSRRGHNIVCHLLIALGERQLLQKRDRLGKRQPLQIVNLKETIQGRRLLGDIR